jgi:hypothetical protein
MTASDSAPSKFAIPFSMRRQYVRSAQKTT